MFDDEQCSQKKERKPMAASKWKTIYESFMVGKMMGNEFHGHGYRPRWIEFWAIFDVKIIAVCHRCPLCYTNSPYWSPHRSTFELWILLLEYRDHICNFVDFSGDVAGQGMAWHSTFRIVYPTTYCCVYWLRFCYGYVFEFMFDG